MSWRLFIVLVLTVSLCGAAEEGKKKDAKKEVPAADPPAAADDPFGHPPASPSPDNPFGTAPKQGSQANDPFGAAAKQGSQADDPFGAIKSPEATKPKPRITKDSLPEEKAKMKPASRMPVESSRAFPSIVVESPRARAVRERIEHALRIDTSFEYLDETLADVVDDIAHRHEIPIVIDRRALEDYGIGTDVPITLNLRGVTLRSALKLMLDDLDLAYVIRDEVLRITTADEAECNLVTRLYHVTELLPAAERPGPYSRPATIRPFSLPTSRTARDDPTTVKQLGFYGGQEGFVEVEEVSQYGQMSPPESDSKPSREEVLIRLITTLVEPDSWDDVGGPGSLLFIDHLDALAISQTEEVLYEVDNLLAAVKELVEAR